MAALTLSLSCLITVNRSVSPLAAVVKLVSKWSKSCSILLDLSDDDVEFEDDNFTRDSIYYVRAIQSATPAINGAPISQRDSFKLCKGSFRTDLEDNCLSMTNERAWSSPIYINKP